MKTHLLLITALATASLHAQKPPTDPYVARAESSEPSGPEDVATLDISICWETFSLPLAMAAKLQRQQLPDSELYKLLLAMVEKQTARQESFTLLRAKSGQKATAESISEQIYPKEFEPPELPNSVGVSISPPDPKETPVPVPDASKLKEAPDLSSFKGVQTPAMPAAFDTRNVGSTLEIEPTLGEDFKTLDLRIVPEIVTNVGRDSWGQGLSNIESPAYESQRINSNFSILINQPFLMGTLNRPPVSKVDPGLGKPHLVWFCYGNDCQTLMRASLVTIVPMLAAAVLVMAGGERMARRDVEKRTPADRERLLDLADSFRGELSRLDQVYLNHLDELARHAIFYKPDQTADDAAAIAGIRLIRIFRNQGSDLNISPRSTKERLPEIELEKRKRPFDPTTAVILDKSLLEKPMPWNGIWISTTNPDLRIHCRQPEPGVLAALLVDVGQVSKITSIHLGDWLSTPLTPLREAGERVEIDPPQGPALVSIGPAKHGPAASILPIRTFSGDWQIRAWDGLVVSTTRDAPTLAAASVISLILAVSGILLYFQQKRALKLAAERVSFVNRVSHELGTPLTNLSLNLDLATEALSSRPMEARRRLGLVAEEIERLSRLVANVLTFSRRERDTLELKPGRCVPEEIIRRTLESFRPALERRGIEIESEISAGDQVLLDSDALSQIAGNLLSNVEKYAATGHWLRIDAQLSKGFLILEVRDKGPGIPAAARQRIFTPFERVLHTTNEGASGTGLGLAIARDLARRMGGTLELLDSPQGAAFRLRIPAPPALAIVSETDAA